jgi:CDP-diacylglycerol--glycerol-3-phosphate 3-phosphatidyltransferase
MAERINRMKTKDKGLISLGLIPDWLDRIFFRSVTPLVKFFSSIRINPNWLTVLGFVQNVVAAVFIASENLMIGGLFIVIAGIFDFIDGKVAAKTHQTTAYGAVLDTVLDRYSDIVIYLGIICYYQKNRFALSAFVTAIALAGSVMTSYLKAVGDSHGIKFRIGALRRQERIALICIGLVFTFLNPGMVNLLHRLSAFFELIPGDIPVMPLTFIIYFLAIFTNFSALQRFLLLRKIIRTRNPEQEKWH